MKKVMFILGTRPEAIKFAPLILEFKKHPDKIASVVCVTAQHRNMLDQVLDFFSIQPDYDLNLMLPGQTLLNVISRSLVLIEQIIQETKPDLIFVQGDTNTAMVGSLAAAYGKVKLAHLEAGLRSHDKHSPFPEELNRIMTGHIADYHFAPTPACRTNLANEGIKQSVFVVGNTVIDALMLGQELLEQKEQSEFFLLFKEINFSKRIILVTSHRRESFGKPLENICEAIISIVQQFPDTQVVFPVHPNPKVVETVTALLKNIPNVLLTGPLEYLHLIWLMKRCHLILTDSGGIQEEAPALGKPVIVLRDKTERQEGIDAGTAVLVGTDYQYIVDVAVKLLLDQNEYSKMARAVNPYGDGTTSRQIVDIVLENILSEAIPFPSKSNLNVAIA